MSVPALVAALLAFFDRQRRAVVWFCGAMLVLGFGMATGSQPFFFLARHLPGLAATDLRRELFFAAMALVILSAIGADMLHELRGRTVARIALGAIALASGTALVWLQMQDESTFASAISRWIAADSTHPLVAGHTLQDIEIGRAHV